MKRALAGLVLLGLVMAASSAGAWYDRHTHKRSDLLYPFRYELAHLRYSYSARADFVNAPGEGVSYHTIDFGGSIPIPITENYLFTVGTKFYLYHFRLHNVTNYYDKSGGNVYFIGLPLSNTFFFGDSWMLDISFMPAISSDLKDVGMHDFQWLGGIVASYIFHDSASFFFGVYATKEFWEYYPIPIIGFIVRPKDSFFDMEVLLPQYVRFNFEVASFCKLFLQGEYYGFVWDMEEQTSSGVPDHMLKFADTQVGAGAKFRPVKGFYIEVIGGVHPYRKYDYANRANQQFNSRQKLGWFAGMTLSIGKQLFGYE